VTAALDPARYLDRIGWRDPLAPDYATLAGLLRAHAASIPFENLDVLLGRGVRLDLPSIERKLVGARRGGYCFEHATLFAAVLETIGFAPVRHSARVTQVLPRHAAPRTHMFLTVTVEGQTYVADPGFGGLAPRVPVPLVARDDAPSGATHWMAHDGAYWCLRARTRDGIVDCWASTLEADNPADFVVANHYTSTHPDSPFVNRIMMQAFPPQGRVTIMNRDCTLWREGEPHRTELPDRAALRRVVAEYFGFDLPELERLRVPSIPGWD
jgi:N-hydroxyarylamine O-acetyltransferase